MFLYCRISFNFIFFFKVIRGHYISENQIKCTLVFLIIIFLLDRICFNDFLYFIFDSGFWRLLQLHGIFFKTSIQGLQTFDLTFKFWASSLKNVKFMDKIISLTATSSFANIEELLTFLLYDLEFKNSFRIIIQSFLKLLKQWFFGTLRILLIRLYVCRWKGNNL